MLASNSQLLHVQGHVLHWTDVASPILYECSDNCKFMSKHM